MKEHDRVLELGGLHVIGTERHESRRIDSQLRGRAGRQGVVRPSFMFRPRMIFIIRGDRMKN